LPPAAVEQLAAEGLFKPAHLQADGRLGQRDRPGCGSE
jgi:hypothetical protein